MPLVLERQAVLDVYAEAAQRKWVIPTFCTENLTTTEAVLTAVLEHGLRIGRDDLPIILGVTNLYPGRTQSRHYTQTRDWRIGLRLFLADLSVLTGPDSPFRHLRVMAHLDHIQHDLDCELLEWDMRAFSSIMYDASALPFSENIRKTAEFVGRRGSQIVIEGACDEVRDASGEERCVLTEPEQARRFVAETGVDIVVANLGTEHRASAAQLHYHGEMARRIRDEIGPRLCLHGCSSVPPEEVRNLFNDGVCKVNIWTMLERDSTPPLFEAMLRQAARHVGAERAASLAREGLLGPKALLSGKADLAFFTTTYRQEIVFEEMKRIVARFLEQWYHPL